MLARSGGKGGLGLPSLGVDWGPWASAVGPGTPAGAVQAGVRATTVETSVGVAARRDGLLAFSIIEPAAALRRLGGPRGKGPMWGGKGNGGVMEPPKPWAIWVTRTSLSDMVFLEAEGTARNCSGAPGEGLIVETGIRDRPVQVLLGESFPPVAAIISYPAAVVKVAFCSDN